MVGKSYCTVALMFCGCHLSHNMFLPSILQIIFTEYYSEYSFCSYWKLLELYPSADLTKMFRALVSAFPLFESFKCLSYTKTCMSACCHCVHVIVYCSIQTASFQDRQTVRLPANVGYQWQ